MIKVISQKRSGMESPSYSALLKFMRSIACVNVPNTDNGCHLTGATPTEENDLKRNENLNLNLE